jgi:ribonuclease-3
VAARVIDRLFRARIAALPPPDALKDAKTLLQEYLQSRGLALPRYTVERVEGEAHAQVFRMICDVTALRVQASGSGSSRRRAEQEAAERVLVQIGQRTGAAGK